MRTSVDWILASLTLAAFLLLSCGGSDDELAFGQGDMSSNSGTGGGGTAGSTGATDAVGGSGLVAGTGAVDMGTGGVALGSGGTMAGTGATDPGTGGRSTVDPGVGTTNLALGKPCESSPGFTAHYPCELALDAIVSQDSRWESQHGVDDAWMYVDLGAVYDVRKIDIYWEHSGALVHEAQVWPDVETTPTDGDEGWVPVAREENLANHEHHDLIESHYEFEPVPSRYVRVRCFERMWEWGNSIFELEVYATATN